MNKKWLFYNEDGNVNLIWYEQPPIELLESENVIEFQGEIPEKEGYSTKIKVVNGEIEIDYELLPLSEEDKLDYLGRELAKMKLEIIRR